MVLDHAIAGVSSSPELDQYTDAKIKAQAQFKAIKKSATHPVDNFRFSTFKDCTDAMLPGLLANGFPMPTFATGYGPKGWVIVAKLTHRSGQWESSVMPLPAGADDSRAGIQSLAADITEAKKVLFKALAGGWEEGEEPEAEEPAKEEAPKEEPKKGAPKPVVKPLSMIQRAEARLREKFSSGPIEDIEKIFNHLDLLVESKEVKQSEVDALRKKYLPPDVEAVSAK
jgi:hypothetical protein